MGPGSRGADKCDEFYLQKGEFIQTLKLYHTPGLGITGTLFVTNKDRYKVFGSITGIDKTYQFTKDLQLIGYSSINENGVKSMQVLSIYKDEALCTPYIQPPPPVPKPVIEQPSVVLA